MTSQEPSVFLVDLADKAAGFTQALAQVGRASVSLQVLQLKAEFAKGPPLCIVARAEDVPKVAEQLRAAQFTSQVPLFVLTPETPGSVRPPLPEVTACVPAEIDAGILALRIQQSLQQVGGPRPRQETVLGMGSMSRPQAIPSRPPARPPINAAPASSGAARGPAAPSTAAPATPIAAAPGSVAPVRAPPAGPSVPWDEPSEERSPIVSSAPALPSSSPASATKSAPYSPPAPSRPPRGVVSSAPPLPEIGRSSDEPSPRIPSVAPVPAAAALFAGPSGAPAPLSGAPAPSSSAPAPSSSAPAPWSHPPASPEQQSGGASEDELVSAPAPTHPPVAMSAPASGAPTSFPDQDNPFASSRPAWLRRGLFAAAAVAILGGGATVFLSRSANQEAASAAAQDELPAAPSEKQTSAATPASGDGATKGARQPEAAKLPAGAEDSAPPSSEPAGGQTQGVAAMFLIEEPARLPACDEVLGRGESEFDSEKKWRATQLWKQARQSLMAGNEELALKRMCESAFIDESGPAAVGLSRYYLGKRALGEAHVWAKRALDAAQGALSKRTAQQALGDVLNQMGKVEEGRALWLESFGLTADQTDRLAPVCRNFVSAAVKARKGGDPALAEILLRRAATFTPDDADTAALLASTLLENEQPALAKLWEKRAIEAR